MIITSISFTPVFNTCTPLPVIESLKITDPVVDLEFQKYTYEYYVTVPKTVDKYEVEAIPEDKNPNVKVSIKGNTDLFKLHK
mgnify:CR=1 FL=1